jgi:hypothetical protein
MPWFKGNLHCHSSRSDGRALPINVGRFYHIQGHDFLGLSDHNRLTPTADCAEPAGLLGIPCCEYTGESSCHVVAIDVEQPVAPAPNKRRKPRPKTVIIQDGIDRTLAAGGIPVVCHPNWHWTLGIDELLKLRNCRHFEICNASPDCNAFPVPGCEPMDNLWDQLLTAGQRYFGLANDDAHEYFIPHMIRTSFGGRAFNVVKTPTLTRKNVVEAVRHGRFYASTGILLDDYSVTKAGMSLRLRQQQQERTVFQFFGSGGRELQRTVGGDATYDFKGDEGYVRVRIGSTCGVWAWTQPVFLDDLADAIRWTRAK